ncbi:LPS assembly lipoprotein LptE [Mucilaginibacter calamicampi]|uniref:LPS assembly lipoprotein LptE n=1 Tax=Mucilaginibacter calamicampi TaxID=1302352 RepID=A0ABW2YXL1_9SPHI
MSKKILLLLTVLPAFFLLPGCAYKLNSNAIPAEMKTVNVAFFENNAPLVVSNLSLMFTEALKARVRTTTRLSIVNGEGDANFSGAITEYRSTPVSIQAPNTNAPPVAGAQALTLTIRVKFDYPPSKEISFDQPFSKSLNYSGNLAAQEQALLQKLTSQIIDDIFNKAFNNW